MTSMTFDRQTPPVKGHRLVVTRDQVDEFAQAQSSSRVSTRLARGFTAHDVAKHGLGFDPSIGKPGADFGGKSRDGWVREYVDLAKLNRLLAQMVADGDLTPVSASDAHVVLPPRARSGFVWTADLDVARQAAEQARAAKLDTQLRDRALRIVAERHADEVEAVLAELRAAQS